MQMLVYGITTVIHTIIAHQNNGQGTINFTKALGDEVQLIDVRLSWEQGLPCQHL